MFLDIAFAASALAALLCYWLAPGQWRSAVLGLGSIFIISQWSGVGTIVLVVSCLAEYLVAKAIWSSDSVRQRRIWLGLSVVGNIGLWLFFKEQRFFGEQLLSALPAWLLPTETKLVHWVAPIGLSFFTFQKMSLSIECFWGQHKVFPKLRDFVAFCLFFPTLASGPIERARRILPQLSQGSQWQWDFAKNAGILLLLGLFKKLFLAGHLAPLADKAFAVSHPDLLTLLFGLWAYAFQLYADFSGYSDMACGIALLFGIKVMENFRAPYLSANIGEYWKRWHISLSSWLNDFVFTPCALALRRFPTLGPVLAVLVTFLLSGFWHGEGWHFIAWGLVHATAIVAHMLSKKKRKALWQRCPEWARMPLAQVITFHTVCLGYLFFRSSDLGDVWHRLSSAATTLPHLESLSQIPTLLALGCLAMIAQYRVQHHRNTAWLLQESPQIRAALYILILLCILHFNAKSQSFLYVQF